MLSLIKIMGLFKGLWIGALIGAIFIVVYHSTLHVIGFSVIGLEAMKNWMYFVNGGLAVLGAIFGGVIGAWMGRK